MRKKLFLARLRSLARVACVALLVGAGALTACSKHDDLWESIEGLEGRVSALEAWQASVNGDISSLRSIVQALQGGTSISNVSPAAGGYVISFTDGTSITIKDGAKGDKGDKGDKGSDGATPKISVAQDKDGYYWTLNGAPLTDAAGAKLYVTGENGTTPLLRIDSASSRWEVSVDGGKTYTPVLDENGNPVSAVGENGDAFFEDVQVTAAAVTFTLADGTSFTLPRGGLVVFSEKELNYLESGDRSATVKINLPEDEVAGIVAELKEVDANTAIVTKAESDPVSVAFGTWGEDGTGSATVTIPSGKATGTAFLKVTVVTTQDSEYSVSRVVDFGAATVTGNTLADALEAGITKIVLDETLDDTEFALNGNNEVIHLQNAFSGKTAEMDLNGNVLDLTFGTGAINFASNSDVTFRNGTININHDGGTDVEFALEKGNSALTFEDVTINITKGGGLLVQGAGNTLTMKGSKVINTSYASFGFSTNAAGANKENALPADIILENTDFVMLQGTAFMNNVPANITATNCRFLANSQAVMLRGGTAVFTDCEFYVKPTVSTNAGRLGTWGQGNTSVWSGLTLGNYNVKDYQYPTNVTMNGKNKVALIQNLGELPAEYQDLFEDRTLNGRAFNLSTAGVYAGIHIAANQAGDHDPSGNFYGVTFNYDPADLTITGIFNEPAKTLEIATANIFVNGVEAEPNLVKAAAQADEVTAAVKAGTPVQLTTDLTVTGTDLINAANTKVAIDLNEQKLTLDKPNATLDVVKGSEIVFENGKLELTHNGAQSMAVSVKTGGTLILKDVEVSATSVPFNAQADCAELRIERSKITTSGSYAIATNASNGGADYGTGGNIVLIDSEFTAGNVALMNNVPAAISCTRCTFTASMQPAFLRGGDYLFEDCTFNITNNYSNGLTVRGATDAMNPYRMLPTGWASGNAAAIGGMIIGNYNNSAYLWPTSVTLTGTTTVNVSGTSADHTPGIHACANAGAGLGVTLNYDPAQVHITYPDGVQPAEGYAPIEFGTTNITVNGQAVTAETPGYVGTQE